ncbi:MAG: MraY family glycosyltransferase [Phycisphaeraceae bacterium]
MTYACLLLLFIGFALSCPLTAVVRRLGGRLGQLDQPGDRKIHDRPIPATGGIAIFWALAAPLALAILAVWVVPVAWWEALLPAAVEHLEGARSQTPLAIALLLAAAALHVTGLIDDRINLGPLLKLGVQLTAAAGLAIFFDIRLLELLGPVASVTITVLWIVALTNAFNFLDNMDGLSAGVAAVAAAIFLTAALLGGQWFVAAVLALLLGALLGFLVFNFPPATIFMGDGGSLVVGFVMAIMSVRITYYDPAIGIGWWAVLTPMLVLAIPLYDLLSVTLIRISQGKSPLVGDTQHFSHRLVRKGLSRRAAVIVIWACTAATGIGAIMLSSITQPWHAGLIATQTGLILLILALLERTPPPPPTVDPTTSQAFVDSPQPTASTHEKVGGVR